MIHSALLCSAVIVVVALPQGRLPPALGWELDSLRRILDEVDSFLGLFEDK